MTVRPAGEADKDWLLDVLKTEWGGPWIERTDEYIDASVLPAFIAHVECHKVGLITLLEGLDHLEIMTLNSFREGCGVGSALVQAAESRARARDLPEARVFTSNDNLHALGFYERRGYRLWAVHRDSITRARAYRKPQIPLKANNGILIADEIELRKPLTG